MILSQIGHTVVDASKKDTIAHSSPQHLEWVY